MSAIYIIVPDSVQRWNALPDDMIAEISLHFCSFEAVSRGMQVSRQFYEIIGQMRRLIYAAHTTYKCKIYVPPCVMCVYVRAHITLVFGRVHSVDDAPAVIAQQHRLMFAHTTSEPATDPCAPAMPPPSPDAAAVAVGMHRWYDPRSVATCRPRAAGLGLPFGLPREQYITSSVYANDAREAFVMREMETYRLTRALGDKKRHVCRGFGHILANTPAVPTLREWYRAGVIYRAAEAATVITA
jgi:hypothetical protein